MDFFTIVNAAVVILGVPTIITTLINIGRKLQTLDSIENDLRENIRPDLKDVRERFFALEGRTSGFFQTASPVKLMKAGEDVLVDSGLKAFIDENQSSLLVSCKNGKEYSNPYDVQKSVFAFFDEYMFSEGFFDKLKHYAYNKGIDMSVLRRIGAIYFRDICLSHHNMDPIDIDKYDPEKTLLNSPE